MVIDDPDRLRRLARLLNWTVAIETVGTPAEASECFRRALPVLPLDCTVWAEPGKPSPANVAAVIQSIEKAAMLAQTAAVRAVVTNPINKAVLTSSGLFPYPGHTEFLAALSGASRVIMMLASEDLRVVPLTIHVPLREVPALITAEAIVETCTILSEALVRFFGIPSARLVLAGLNPHAGEAGTMGDEEERVIRPAADALVAQGLNVVGPVSADTLFTRDTRATYDAAVCMYHDQALIPIKTLAMDSAVNVTLGLPFIRTSPDHGTAFDIAGTGAVRPDSFIAAIHLADRMAATRFPAPVLVC